MATHVSPVPPARRNHRSTGVPVEVVRQLMAAARQHAVRRLLVRTADAEIQLELEVDVGRPSDGPSDRPADEPDLVEVLAPAVGVVRLAPGAGGSPGLAVGDVVGPDDQVAQIEAMKMTTTVVAGRAGTVREVCVRDGDVVEFRQPLVRIEPGEGGSDGTR